MMWQTTETSDELKYGIKTCEILFHIRIFWEGTHTHTQTEKVCDKKYVPSENIVTLCGKSLIYKD